MTTRRGRPSGSGQPGTAGWRRTIEGIKQELSANNRALIETLEEQEAEKAEEVQPLFDLAHSLRVSELLSYMNDTILEGQGVIQTVLRWEEGIDLDDVEYDVEYVDDEDDDEDDEDWEDDEDEEDDEDDDWDDDDEDEGTIFLFVVLSVILTWKEAGRIQIKVDIQEDDETSKVEVRVNTHPVSPPTARNLQNVLVTAFREQMDEDYGNFEEE